MLWYHYALLFYWAVSGTWLYLDHNTELVPVDIKFFIYVKSLLFGWVTLPAVLIGRALR